MRQVMLAQVVQVTSGPWAWVWWAAMVVGVSAIAWAMVMKQKRLGHAAMRGAMVACGAGLVVVGAWLAVRPWVLGGEPLVVVSSIVLMAAVVTGAAALAGVLNRGGREACGLRREMLDGTVGTLAVAMLLGAAAAGAMLTGGAAMTLAMKLALLPLGVMVVGLLSSAAGVFAMQGESVNGESRREAGKPGGGKPARGGRGGLSSAVAGAMAAGVTVLLVIVMMRESGVEVWGLWRACVVGVGAGLAMTAVVGAERWRGAAKPQAVGIAWVSAGVAGLVMMAATLLAAGGVGGVSGGGLLMSAYAIALAATAAMSLRPVEAASGGRGFALAGSGLMGLAMVVAVIATAQVWLSRSLTLSDGAAEEIAARAELKQEEKRTARRAAGQDAYVEPLGVGITHDLAAEYRGKGRLALVNVSAGNVVFGGLIDGPAETLAHFEDAHPRGSVLYFESAAWDPVMRTYATSVEYAHGSHTHEDPIRIVRADRGEIVDVMRFLGVSPGHVRFLSGLVAGAAAVLIVAGVGAARSAGGRKRGGVMVALIAVVSVGAAAVVLGAAGVAGLAAGAAVGGLMAAGVLMTTGSSEGDDGGRAAMVMMRLVGVVAATALAVLVQW